MSYAIITGADGYIGSTVCERLLERTELQLLACVRAHDEQELARKRAALAQRFGSGFARVQVVPLDLRREDVQLPPEAQAAQLFIHAAALTNFDVEREDALAVNVRGTARACRLARGCKQLRRFTFISTLYSSGLRGGDILEQPFDAQPAFANHYEWSKWTAESLLMREHADLPWQIARVGTVLCHDESGAVRQLNVAHKIWRLLYLGLLPVVPGDPETRLHLVSGAFAADAICQLAQRAAVGQIAHVCSNIEGGLDLQSFVDGAFDYFQTQPSFRKRRILKPLFTTEESFYALANTAGMFSRDALRDVAKLMRPFVKQAFVQKKVQARALANLALTPPSLPALVPKCCAHLCHSTWAATS
jgi:nucleoside-diphosphate-sugar epimerase